MAKKKETNFRNNIVVPFLKSLRNTVIFSIQQVTLVGHPDIILCCNGRFVAIEVKTDVGKESEIQKYYRGQIVTKGQGIAILLKPKNFVKVKKFLFNLSEGVNDPSILSSIV